MKLAAARNNVLSALLGSAHHQWVRLGQLLQALHQLGQVLAILGLHRNLDNRRHAVLHVGNVVGILQIGDGARLQDVLIHADKGDSVATRHILDLLSGPAHHQDCSLDVLHMQVLLGPGLVVRTLDSHLLSRGNGAREHAAKGVEAALVRGGNHLGDVHHQRACRIAAANAVGRRIIHGTLVQVLHAVLLGLPGGGQLGHDHAQQSVRGIDPDLHGSLHERLASQGFLVALQHNAQGAHHLLILLLVIIHDGPHQLVDGAHDELAESSLQRLSATLRLHHVGPHLLLGIEERVAPHALHHLLLLHAHLGGIDLGKALSGEAPSVKAAAKRHSALLWGHLHITHQGIVVGGNDHVHVLDGLSEARIHVLGFHLQLQNAAIHLVHEEAWPHSLLQSLSQHRLRLHSAAFNAIHHDHGAVCDSQGCCHL
mmetsp:Transcript_42537/g.101379  ORF Transcript_42537/g.101379 Transcript_42537/m.101379 type:complete len:426 (+) Transcript_42537:1066-2343(+)